MKTYYNIFITSYWRNFYNINSQLHSIFPNSKLDANNNNFIYRAFYWDATPQKYNYWVKIHNMWLKLHYTRTNTKDLAVL